MSPTTNKQWIIRMSGNTFDSLKRTENPIPSVGEYDVLIKIEAFSLNYRDASISINKYPFPSKTELIPCSDAAGTVTHVGKVTSFRPGDAVTSLFFAGHIFGAPTAEAQNTGLGGFHNGCLQQYRVFHEMTWNALYELKPLGAGQAVLVQGTRGVPFLLRSWQGAAQRLIELGADHVINYREDPGWGATARKLTRDGVYHVTEVGGRNTMRQSLNCVKREGVVYVIGYIGGTGPGHNQDQPPQILDTLTAAAIAIEANNIRPVVSERVFELCEAREAYQYLWDQRHFGKVEIQV
ncbi:zinc-dependent alcohol dehydrogenase family protein [Aspergillus saccharolyticus JOP 1030-1]|uniref:GroES-like protein n=1 Tax=Aspergillus saccharolyticus JOP 1030-1 TaxID=1450539 RepID=A0A318ZBA5_9EURO|nr:GroES-like protein [Aspergillus saccharolyticus JOP 1030-1]PYH44725.1 GroES-like protein [Aspergillus saccharolyticus JOP 1030-1]